MPHEIVKRPARIRVWVAISARGKIPLIKIDKKMNAEGFATLLKEKLIPCMRNCYEGDSDEAVFVQDGDGTHTARKSRNCSKKRVSSNSTLGQRTRPISIRSKTPGPS